MTLVHTWAILSIEKISCYACSRSCLGRIYRSLLFDVPKVDIVRNGKPNPTNTPLLKDWTGNAFFLYHTGSKQSVFEWPVSKVIPVLIFGPFPEDLYQVLASIFLKEVHLRTWPLIQRNNKEMQLQQTVNEENLAVHTPQNDVFLTESVLVLLTFAVGAWKTLFEHWLIEFRMDFVGLYL